jgi:hypothetical protein
MTPCPQVLQAPAGGHVPDALPADNWPALGALLCVHHLPGCRCAGRRARSCAASPCSCTCPQAHLPPTPVLLLRPRPLPIESSSWCGCEGMLAGLRGPGPLRALAGGAAGGRSRRQAPQLPACMALQGAAPAGPFRALSPSQRLRRAGSCSLPPLAHRPPHALPTAHPRLAPQALRPAARRRACLCCWAPSSSS